MRKRVHNYMKYVEEILSKDISGQEKETFISEFLIQLQFYQHERLIHLLVTITFAIIAVIALVANYIFESLLLGLFDVGMLVMLLFYIRHYFFLERSVQKMYTYYDRLVEPRVFTDNIIEP